MPTHDIIDNRNEKLVHHFNPILTSIIIGKNGWIVVVSQATTTQFRGLFVARGWYKDGQAAEVKKCLTKIRKRKVACARRHFRAMKIAYRPIFPDFAEWWQAEVNQSAVK